MPLAKLKVIDSHTGGEPTRVVVEGIPELSGTTLAEKINCLRDHHDWIRTSLVTEPRGSEVMVGAILLPASKPEATAGVIYFNNIDYLGMCGHGTIGLVATLAHLGKISPSSHLLETCVGDVPVTLHEDGKVTLENVASYRYKKDVAVEVPELGTVVGDIAWGGNWFFLIGEHNQSVTLSNVDQLSYYTKIISEALQQQGITGENGGLIDHIEVFSAPDDSKADSKSFVLCPGGQYDRSPCGTGTSAKVACLAADGKLAENQPWRQQSVTGSIFEACYSIRDGKIYPQITGQAYVNAEVTVLIDENDPLRFGLK